MNYQRLNRTWQCLTLLAAPILLTLLIYYRNDFPLYTWLLWLHIPLLMLHEAEEYVFSPVSFKEFANLKTPIGSGHDPDYPLDDAYCFQVNILIAWPLVIAGALLADKAPWLGMAMVWFQVILNNIMHTMLFHEKKKPAYNPGLVTNCFLLVPLCVITIITASGFFTWTDWSLSALIGLGLAGGLFTKTMIRLKKPKARS